MGKRKRKITNIEIDQRQYEYGLYNTNTDALIKKVSARNISQAEIKFGNVKGGTYIEAVAANRQRLAQENA